MAVERFALVADESADSVPSDTAERLSVTDVSVIGHEYVVHTGLLHRCHLAARPLEIAESAGDLQSTTCVRSHWLIHRSIRDKKRSITA